MEEDSAEGMRGFSDSFFTIHYLWVLNGERARGRALAPTV